MTIRAMKDEQMQITIELAKADYEALSEQATKAQMSVEQLVASIRSCPRTWCKKPPLASAF